MMINQKGNSVVEFVLVLPWFLLALLTVIYFSLWIMGSQMGHYAAYQGARNVSLYTNERAENEVERIAPGSLVQEISSKKIFKIKRTVGDLALPLLVGAPIPFALEGMKLNLSNQGQMDNQIQFCGTGGNYYPC